MHTWEVQSSLTGVASLGGVYLFKRVHAVAWEKKSNLSETVSLNPKPALLFIKYGLGKLLLKCGFHVALVLQSPQEQCYSIIIKTFTK